MKIKLIEIEATSEELKSARPLSDVLYGALCSVESAARKTQSDDGDEGEAEE